MSYTPYDDSFPVVQDALRSMTRILKKAEERPNAADLPKARLYADMHPLTFQVQMCGQISVRLVARLSGTQVVDFEGELVTFADMFDRIDKAQEHLAKVDRDFINSRADEKIMVGIVEGRRAPVVGNAVIFGYILPTIFFHLTTAYAILRKEGVPLGKSDYIDGFGDRYTAGL